MRRPRSEAWAPDASAARIKKLLVYLKRSPYQVAPFFGVTPQAIYTWLNGTSVPGPKARAAIEQLETKFKL